LKPASSPSARNKKIRQQKFELPVSLTVSEFVATTPLHISSLCLFLLRSACILKFIVHSHFSVISRDFVEKVGSADTERSRREEEVEFMKFARVKIFF